jgi:restriction system protein
MVAFQALVEDLMEFGLRLRPRVGVALAIVSWMMFHVVSRATVPVVGQSTLPGMLDFTLQGLLHFGAFFLQFAVPFCLMVGVLVSMLRRRRAKTIMSRSRENPKTAIAAMSWRHFEQLVGEAFRLQGFSVLEMGGPGPDGGVDLVLHKDGKRYLCQCKHWKTWAVGVGVVRELKGVIAAQEADGGYVITGGHFTREAEVFARQCGIELIDGLALERMILLVNATDRVALVKPESVAPMEPQCPKCGAAMQEKVAQQGAFKGQPFWSCSTFPKCRGKVHIERVA